MPEYNLSYFTTVMDLLLTLPFQQGWLWVFLKVYIRAFQQASDLDENSEDKILVGDRPKQGRDLVKLKERLRSRRVEELEDVGRFKSSLATFDIL